MATNEELLALIQNIELPEAMTESANFVELMKGFLENQPIPGNREESFRIQSQMTAGNIAATLEMLANMGDIDRQLRQIGERLKALED